MLFEILGLNLSKCFLLYFRKRAEPMFHVAQNFFLLRLFSASLPDAKKNSGILNDSYSQVLWEEKLHVYPEASWPSGRLPEKSRNLAGFP